MRPIAREADVAGRSGDQFLPGSRRTSSPAAAGCARPTADYLTFCRTLLNGGELGGVRLLGPKTLTLMTSNHLPGGHDLPAMSRSLFSEATYNGIGFGLGFAVTIDPAKTLIPGSPGEYSLGRRGDDLVLDRSRARI